MATLYLHVEALPGDIAEDVCAEACTLANRLGVGVVCNFNGTNIRVMPGMTPKEAYDRWWHIFNVPAAATPPPEA